MKRFFDWFNNLYPVWLVGLAILAFLKPQTMLWFDKPWIFWSLAASMLGMGLTLNPSELPRRAKQGFTQVAVQSDLALLRDAFRTIIQDTKESPS